MFADLEGTAVMMKFTKRRNGHDMGTMQIRYHIPKEMFDFIHQNTEKTLSETEAWIWLNLHELCDDWKALIIDDGDPLTTSTDDIDYYDDKDCLVYEGPGIVRRRR
jgi:hypothetical protein